MCSVCINSLITSRLCDQLCYRSAFTSKKGFAYLILECDTGHIFLLLNILLGKVKTKRHNQTVPFFHSTLYIKYNKVQNGYKNDKYENWCHNFQKNYTIKTNVGLFHVILLFLCVHW